MNSYEDFLQAINELYDQNKLDFNNYKLLKKEIESMEEIHIQHQTEYRNYFRMLEDKINNVVVSGGGLTENQVQNIISSYISSHKSELTGPQGPQGPQGSQGVQGPQGIKGTDGLTTKISVNGKTYTQSNGLITLPNYPTLSGSGSSVSYIIWVGTQSQYDTITSKDNNTLYFIKEE